MTSLIGEEAVARVLAAEHFDRKQHYGACTKEERVAFAANQYWRNHLPDARAAISAHLAALKEAGWMPMSEFLECALYDALMEGPRFKGWNRSALDRLRQKCEAIMAAPPAQNGDEVKGCP